MEDAFRFATLALFEANEAPCTDEPRGGRGAQHTILDVPALLERPGFRRQMLKKTRDPVIHQWFDGYFEPLERRYQLEIINPVQTKVHKYLGSRVARQIVGQPCRPRGTTAKPPGDANPAQAGEHTRGCGEARI